MSFIDYKREGQLCGLDWLQHDKQFWCALCIVINYNKLVACLDEQYIWMVRGSLNFLRTEIFNTQHIHPIMIQFTFMLTQSL